MPKIKKNIKIIKKRNKKEKKTPRSKKIIINNKKIKKQHKLKIKSSKIKSSKIKSSKIKSSKIKPVQKIKRKYTKRVVKDVPIVPNISTITITPTIVTGKLPRKKRSKSNTSKMYFTQDTENAIIQYNNESDINIREKIFHDKIHYPFQKLVENVFNTFKFTYFETGPQDAQRECLTHLVANMHKFDPERRSKTDPNKKSKAYSYFSIIAKHYLILLNNTTYAKFNRNVELSDDRDENTIQLQSEDKYYAQKELSDFMKLLVEFWENNVNKIFSKSRDLNIANAVVNLFRNSDRIDTYNKKALYLYIREMSMCKTQQITKVINKMKQYHNNIQQSYIDTGDVNI